MSGVAGQVLRSGVASQELTDITIGVATPEGATTSWMVVCEAGEIVRRWNMSRCIPKQCARAALIVSAWETATMVLPLCWRASSPRVTTMRLCISKKDSPSGKRKLLGVRCTTFQAGSL